MNALLSTSNYGHLGLVEMYVSTTNYVAEKVTTDMNSLHHNLASWIILFLFAGHVFADPADIDVVPRAVVQSKTTITKYETVTSTVVAIDGVINRLLVTISNGNGEEWTFSTDVVSAKTVLPIQADPNLVCPTLTSIVKIEPTAKAAGSSEPHQTPKKNSNRRRRHGQNKKTPSERIKKALYQF